MTPTPFPGRLRLSHQLRRETELRRRNGKLQSCEPCRKGKLRCDHMMPACGRCTRRNKQEQCIYHPAPLTKANTQTTPEIAETDDSPPLLVNVNLNPPASLPFPPFDDTPVTQQRTSPEDTAAGSDPVLMGCLSRRPVTTGQLTTENLSLALNTEFISYSAIIAENEPSLGLLPPISNSLTVPSISQAQVDKGAAILAMLKDLPLFETYVEKRFRQAWGSVLLEPMMKIWTTGIWSSWRKVLVAQKADELRTMSEKVWSNTLKPLSGLLNRHTTPREFSTKTTGDGLRWEIVGLLLNMVGTFAMSLTDGDPIFYSHDELVVDRQALALSAYSGSESCVTFCREFETVNDLYLWLLYGNVSLANVMGAKGSYRNWMRAGGLASALLACGLHQKIEVNDKTPFFITELRKRLFICQYKNDKYSSAFAGRPPRLTRHYCQLQLPLDLTDAQLMSEGRELEAALASLDAGGWNTNGFIMPCTFSRIYSSYALLMEEILEISLGNLAVEEIVRRAKDIEDRGVRLWENIPPFLRLEDTIFWDRRRAPIELLFLAHTRICDFEVHFLLQRTLIKKANAGSEKLLSVSREMFAFMLLLLNHRDELHEFQLDLIHMLCMNGIPTAAVIAVELLHQEQDPISAAAMLRPLPRSDTIQDLSVFVSSLGGIRPDTWGFAICNRGRRFLKKILDTILDPPPPDASLNSNNVEDPSGTTPTFQTGNDGDFMKWLEQMEWDQEDWLNFT